MALDPIDRAFESAGADQRFMAMHGGTRECVCPTCKTVRNAPIETRAELIARVAAEMRVGVSDKRPARVTLTPDGFGAKWAALRAAQKRRSVMRWR